MKYNKLYTFALLSFVLVGPLLDLSIGYFQRILYSTSELTPGVLYRGVLLTTIFTIFTFRTNTNIRFIFIYFIMVFLLSNIIYLTLNYDIHLYAGVKRILKILFPIIGLGAMLFLEKYINVSKNIPRLLWGIASWYGVIVALSIILFYIFGFNLVSYQYQLFSSKAIFQSQNSTGIVLVLSFPILLYYLHEIKKSSQVVIVLIISLFLISSLLVSTRAAVVGTPLTALMFYLFLLVRKRRGKDTNKKVKIFLTILSVIYIGYNIFLFWIDQDVAFTIKKFNLLLEGNLRGRVPDGLQQIANFTLWQHLFGVGELKFRLTENDIVDIYGKLGLLILIPLLLFFLYYYVGLLKAFLLEAKLSTFVLLLSLTFYIVHASLAGHAFANAPVNNLFLLIYYISHKELDQIRFKENEYTPQSRIGNPNSN